MSLDKDFVLRFRDIPYPVSLKDQALPDLPLIILSAPYDSSNVHSHDFIELIYVRNGAGIHHHGPNQYHVYAGDCFLVAPGEEHDFVNVRELETINFLFYPDFLDFLRGPLLEIPGFVNFFSIEPFFREETAFQHKLHLRPPEQSVLIGLHDRLKRELTTREPGFKVATVAYFLELVIFISRCYSKIVATGNVEKELSRKEEIVSAAISFLEKNYVEDIKLNDVARSAFISSSRLCHLFKETTGMPIFDYLNKMRCDQACRLLADTSDKLPDIAALIGFHDPSYFGRIFKKITGMSPSEYRKKANSSEKMSNTITSA